MMKKLTYDYTKKQRCLILTGLILCIVSIMLSYCKSVVSSSFNGWTGEGASSVGGFMSGMVLVPGIIEIALLFSEKTAARVVGVMASVAKLTLPWLVFNALNTIGRAAFDAMFTYEIINSLPYVLTVCSGLSVVQEIVMAVVLIIDKRKNKEEQKYENYIR